MLKFGTKNALFGYFWARILNTIVILEINILKFVKLQNFTEKQNCINLAPKMRYFGIFGVKL